MRPVPVEPLTAQAFAPFGTVLEPGGDSARLIRDGAVRLTQFPGFLGHDAAASVWRSITTKCSRRKGR